MNKECRLLDLTGGAQGDIFGIADSPKEKNLKPLSRTVALSVADVSIEPSFINENADECVRVQLCAGFTGLAGVPIKYGIVFSDGEGSPIKSTDPACANGCGVLSVAADFIPRFDEDFVIDVWFWITQAAFDLPAGEHQLKMAVILWDVMVPENFLTKSIWYPFRLNKM